MMMTKPIEFNLLGGNTREEFLGFHHDAIAEIDTSQHTAAALASMDQVMSELRGIMPELNLDDFDTAWGIYLGIWLAQFWSQQEEHNTVSAAMVGAMARHIKTQFNITKDDSDA